MHTRAIVLALGALAAAGFAFAVEAQQTASPSARVIVYKSPT